jgi:sugar/nucleoside kinase (ribokinase family)
MEIMNIEVSLSSATFEIPLAQSITLPAFKYTTPKLRLDDQSLLPDMLAAKSFHLICSPKRCIDLANNISGRRFMLNPKPAGPPLFIWEPVPDLCTPEEYDNCLEALKLVDCVSPNHSELASFFGKKAVKNGNVDHEVVRQCVSQWLKSGIGAEGNGSVVVRAGKDGCYVATRQSERWIPAYHQSTDKVVDPTGGGNGFLGGLGVGLVRGNRHDPVQCVEEAAIMGSVAASFAIEQIGMPTLVKQADNETWNGVLVDDRLQEFKSRLGQYIQP